jgi:hypothetical protein
MDIPKKQFIQQTKKLLNYMMERLKIKNPPSKLVLKNNKENAEKPWGYTGNYNPQDKSITLFITDRHHVDILRSFAHEVIHHWQNENGQLLLGNKDNADASDPQYAQKDAHLRKMEKQAFLLGNMIFRDFEDIERFGKTNIVNEEVDPKFDRWVKSMVNTVEESVVEMGQSQIDIEEAYDIIKSNYRSSSPSQEIFDRACREAVKILKNTGIVK